MFAFSPRTIVVAAVALGRNLSTLRVVGVLVDLSSLVGEVWTEAGGSLPETLAGRHLDLNKKISGVFFSAGARAHLALVEVGPAGTAVLTGPALHLLNHLNHLHHLRHGQARLDGGKGRDDACKAVDEVTDYS